MDQRVSVDLPRWVMWLYGLMAVVLTPWVVNLAINLPSRHLDRHWDALWAGFDGFIILAILLTIWFMIKHKIWVVVPASALATLFLVDAWFDNLTARPGLEQREAIAFGFVEIILSLMTYRLVYHIIRRAGAAKHIKLSTKQSSKK